MDSVSNTKEVRYDQYCPLCEHWREPESSDICNECLGTPYNINSHKPTEFKEGGKDS